ARSAAIGLLRVARRAGRYPATAATVVSTANIPPNVAGSVDVTPYRSPLTARASAHDAHAPTPIPTAASPSVCRIIRLCRPAADAPSAIRIPISCARWLTEYEITP